jgi:hypothetical protein
MSSDDVSALDRNRRDAQKQKDEALLASSFRWCGSGDAHGRHEHLVGFRRFECGGTDSDRTVHAVTYRGVEIVRYNRAGKWYLEWPATAMVPCRHVGVDEAARTAVEHSGDIRLGLSGGKAFDARVRKIRGF